MILTLHVYAEHYVMAETSRTVPGTVKALYYDDGYGGNKGASQW